MRRATSSLAVLGVLLPAVVTGCGGAEERASRPRPSAASLDVSFGAGATDLIFGERAELTGLVGRATEGRVVRLEHDPYPFDRFEPVDTARSEGGGYFEFRPKPDRNTRYRAVLEGSPPGESEPLTVTVEMRADIVARRVAPGRAELRYTAKGPPDLRARRTRVHFYRLPRGEQEMPRVASGMVRPGGPGFVVAEAGTLVPIQPGDRFSGCAEGPLAEGLGRRGGSIEQCGSPSLPASDFGV